MLLSFSFCSVWLPGKVEKVMENISLNLLFVILKIGMSRSILWSRLDSFVRLSSAEIVLYGIPNRGNLICRILFHLFFFATKQRIEKLKKFFSSVILSI